VRKTNRELAIYHLLEWYGEYAKRRTSFTDERAIEIRKFLCFLGYHPYTGRHMRLKVKMEREA